MNKKTAALVVAAGLVLGACTNSVDHKIVTQNNVTMICESHTVNRGFLNLWTKKTETCKVVSP